MTTAELIQYYVNLLIIQYHEKPKAKAHIEAIVTECVADQLIAQVRDGFDIETAVGAQLDIVGKYVGIPRIVNGFPFGRDYFEMPSYDDPSPTTYFGFGLYGAEPAHYFAYYADAENQYIMNDYEMRYIIKLKIAQQNSNHSLESIDDIVDEFFQVSGSPILSVTDNLDMTINYDFSGDIQIIHRLAVYLDCLPHPAGVQPITTGL